MRAALLCLVLCACGVDDDVSCVTRVDYVVADLCPSSEDDERVQRGGAGCGDESVVLACGGEDMVVSLPPCVECS